ncbi:cytochrome b5-like heme/steroid binding domain-containing protein [Encephalitozoon hellem]|nr:cytochrome b5-like heme/steroid binding domain-containing protein [Encephalitozoon hellem]
MNLIRWSRERRRAPSFRTFTVEEVSRHDKVDDCWIIMDGVVYDVTDFLRLHPGGIDVIMKHAGRDCTDAFNKAHPHVNKELLLGSVIGTVVKE